MMNKMSTTSPGEVFQQQPCSVEFEIPVVLLRLVTRLLDCQETFLVQTETPFAAKIVKNDNYVKFFFTGDDNCRPVVELVNNRWRCKIAAGSDINGFKGSEPNGTALEEVQLNSDKLDNVVIPSVVSSFNVAETEHQVRNIKKEQALADEILIRSVISDNEVTDANALKRARQSTPSTKKRCKKSCKTEPSSDIQPEEQNVEATLSSSRQNNAKPEETSITMGASEEILAPTNQSSSTNRPRNNKTKKIKKEADRVINCPGCTKRFDTMTKLTHHVRKSHQHERDYNELTKKLEDLAYVFSSRSQSLLVQNCSVCGRERRGVTLLNHLTVWHSDCENYEQLIEEAKAGYRQNKLAVKLEREKHLFRLQANVCPYCSKDFAHRASYRKHMTYTCEMNPNRRPLFNCNTCGYSSPNAEAFKRHQEQHEAGTKFVCDLCGKEYCNRSGLVVHQRDIHRITKKIPIRYHVCPECQQEFYCKNHYERHVRTHYDDRPMQCDLCGKQFKHLDHLNRHRREIHQNKYRYQCDKCGHGMAKQSYLKNHKCGRIRRAQSAQLELENNGSNQTGGSDTAVLRQTQSVSCENEQFAYSELFTVKQDKQAADEFAVGVYDPSCSLGPGLYPLPDGLQSIGWTPNVSAELIADNSSSNGLLISSLLSTM